MLDHSHSYNYTRFTDPDNPHAIVVDLVTPPWTGQHPPPQPRSIVRPQEPLPLPTLAHPPLSAHRSPVPEVVSYPATMDPEPDLPHLRFTLNLQRNIMPIRTTLIRLITLIITISLYLN